MSLVRDLNLRSRLVWYWQTIFGGSTTIASGTVKSSLLGKLSFLESVLLQKPKIVDTIVRDVSSHR